MLERYFDIRHVTFNKLCLERERLLSVTETSFSALITFVQILSQLNVLDMLRLESH